MTEQDKKIFNIQKQIEEKEALLLKTASFAPQTNCILELNGQRYNLNVCKVDELKFILITLNTFVMSSKDLVIELPTISNYTFDNWIHDIRGKIAIKSVDDEKAKLKAAKDKLSKLLSETAQTELAITEIINSL